MDPKRGQLTMGNVSDTTVGLFVQDAWTVSDRLTVNAGLRTENETVPFYSTGRGGQRAANPFLVRQQAGAESRRGVGRLG